MTDREISALLSAGKTEEAFNAIVDSYSESLYWHIRHFSLSHEDTDDLLQNIYIKVWRALENFRGDSGVFTWLWRIATNEVLNHIRSQKFKALLARESYERIMDRAIDEDAHFDGDHLQRELLKAIGRLPEKQKAVFNMRWFDSLSYEDISKITGTSVGALKASYHHAYMKIKEYLEKRF